MSMSDLKEVELGRQKIKEVRSGSGEMKNQSLQ
jgi:hypothetical protein